MVLKNKAVAFAAAAVLAVGCFGLTACCASQEADSGDDKAITVGATPTPHAEVLENAVAPILEEQGYDLQVTVFEDYVQPNTAVESGELEAAQVSHSLEDVDFGIINGNYALEAGLNIADALAVESSEGVAAEQYGNIIAVADGNQDSEKIKALVAACQSDEVAKYIEDTYNGVVVPLTLS